MNMPPRAQGNPHSLSRSSRQRASVTLLSIALSVGCAHDEQRLSVPAPDAPVFEQAVYPVLLRDCGFPACHGDQARFLQVFGPGRSRLDGSTSLYEPATVAELERSYQRARSMLAYEQSPSEALLLRKPLAVAAGGAGHKGLDLWGNDVYHNREASGFRTLLAWALQAAGSAP